MNVINNMAREKRLEMYPEREPSIPRIKMRLKKHLDSQVKANLQKWVEFSQLVPTRTSELKLIEYPNKILLIDENKNSCSLLIEYDLIECAFICTGEENSLLTTLKIYAEYITSASKSREKIDLDKYDAITKLHFTDDEEGKLWYMLRAINRPIVYDPNLIFTQEQQLLALKILRSIDYGGYSHPDPRVSICIALGFF